MIYKQKNYLTVLLTSFVLIFSTIFAVAAQAACSTTPDPSQGTDSVNVSAPTNGTYYVWAQMQASASSNSFYMQVNGGCAIQVGGSANIPSSGWTWVNYQNGNSATLIPVALTTSTNQISLTGNGAGVGVESLFFAPLDPSTGCSPTNTSACTVTNTAPTVTMTKPGNNATVSGTTTVSSTATGNNGATIKSVQFQLNGQNLGTAVNTPVSGSTYQTTWDTTKSTNGAYNLTAIATDSNNLSMTSAQMPVTVSNQVTQTKPGAPTGLKNTSLTSTQVGLSWTAPTGSDPAASYKIYRNGTSIGTSSTTSYTDSNVSPSTTYSYTVSGVDANSAEGPQSTNLNVAVPSAPDTIPPTVKMTAPPAGNVSGKVTLSASASDNVQVKTVQFYLDYSANNTTTLGSVINPQAGSKTYNASYSWDTTTLANGQHTVTAVVSDGTNPAVAATPVSVTVNNQQSGGGGSTHITLSFNSSTNTLSWNAYSGASSYTVAQISSTGTIYSWPHVSGVSCVPGGTCNVPVPSSGETLNYNVDPLSSSGTPLDSPAWTAATPISVTWPTGGTSGTPPVPTGLTATPSGSSQINLKWTETTSVSDPAKSFQIFRRSGTSGSFAQVGSATNTTYGDTGLKASTTYSYYVVAVDSANHASAQPSNTANATTQAVTSSKYNATVMGVITNSKTGSPIQGVHIVTASQATANGSESTYTNSKGQYVLTGLDSTAKHHYYNTASGYVSQTYYVQLPAGTTIGNIKLTPQ
ncbi:MAG: Ig-like domain-containing protein [Candidatus Saccharimonadales bacterium]